jgi:hypothetical protein
MRVSDPEKVLKFLEEVYEATKVPTKLSLSKFITKHSLSYSYAQALTEMQVLRKINDAKRNAIYEWYSVRPPNDYMAKILIFRIAEIHQKEKQLLEKKRSELNPKPIKPVVEIPADFVNEVAELNSKITVTTPNENPPTNEPKSPAPRIQKPPQVVAELNRLKQYKQSEVKNKEFSFFWGMLKFKW